MQLENSFTVPVPPADAWQAFQDIAAVAPCMPGAVLDSAEGDTFAGRVKVKVGAVQMSYRGEGTIARDEPGRTITLDLTGSETRGAGTAAAKVTAHLSDDGTGTAAGTRITVRTDLDLTGRPAQFGRGILVEVADRLIQQFARNLAAYLAAGPEATGTTTASGAAAAEPEAVDLGAAVLPVLARRAAKPAAVAGALGLLGWLLVRALRRGNGESGAARN
ncbi:SRPBCC family protein [Streptomyces sp. NPDC050400]|uniref:SRPBCC family protein n=1 Tax=Streptomyces sp. NPDC050400 TaxID=3365610 RepID=UPI0037BBFCA5